MTTKPLLRLAAIAAIAIPVAAIAASRTYDAGGIADGYSVKNPSVQITDADGIIAPAYEYEDGGRYIHWYGSSFSTTGHANIEAALNSGTLMISGTRSGKLKALNGKAGLDTEISVVICDDEHGTATPADDTACTCKGAREIGNGSVTWQKSFKNSSTTVSSYPFSFTQGVHISLNAGESAIFDSNSWVCALVEATGYATIYSDTLNITDEASAHHNYLFPTLNY